MVVVIIVVVPIVLVFVAVVVVVRVWFLSKAWFLCKRRLLLLYDFLFSCEGRNVANVKEFKMFGSKLCLSFYEKL